MPSIEQNLKKRRLILPEPAAPKGNYLPFRQVGNVLHLAGVLALRDGKISHAGQVGAERSVKDGYAAAQICALNALATIKLATGDLERVDKIIFVNGYVNAVSGFQESPQVINGASDLFAEILGERGKHARAAVAVAGLPLNSTVELQVIVELK